MRRAETVLSDRCGMTTRRSRDCGSTGVRQTFQGLGFS